MRVALFGATGRAGRGVLLECLDDGRVEYLVAVGPRAAARREGLSPVLQARGIDASDRA